MPNKMIDIMPIRVRTDSYGNETDVIETNLVNPAYIVEAWPTKSGDVTSPCYVRIAIGNTTRVERSNHSIVWLQNLLQQT